VGADPKAPAVDALREFLVERLPEYMVPAAFVTLSTLPTTQSGKVDRRALPAPDWSQAVQRADFVAPSTATERELEQVWSELLEVDEIGRNDDFFDLGGSSLLAIRLTARIREHFGVELPLITLFSTPKLGDLAGSIDDLKSFGASNDGGGRLTQTFRVIADSLLDGRESGGTSLAKLQTADHGTPLFCIHGLGGHVSAFLPLARHLEPQRPVYGLQAQGLEAGQRPHERIEDMAAFYLEEIRSVQPRGPYLLAGWSLGGIIALEAARQLKEHDQTVALLAMLDTYMAITDRDRSATDENSILKWIAPHLKIPKRLLRGLDSERQWELVAQHAERAAGIGRDEVARLIEVSRAHLSAAASYQPQVYTDPVVLFRCGRKLNLWDRRFGRLCGDLNIERVEGDHFSMLREPAVKSLAETLSQHLVDREPLDNVTGNL
jgi:thioesterase domain-containing protein/acyl carrier protein